MEVALLVGLGYRFGESARLAHEIRWIELGLAVLLAGILVVPLFLKSRLVRKQRRAASA